MSTSIALQIAFIHLEVSGSPAFRMNPDLYTSQNVAKGSKTVVIAQMYYCSASRTNALSASHSIPDFA